MNTVTQFIAHIFPSAEQIQNKKNSIKISLSVLTDVKLHLEPNPLRPLHLFLLGMGLGLRFLTHEKVFYLSYHFHL